MRRRNLSRKALLSFILTTIARVTSANVASLDPQREFGALGLDSVAIVELTAQIEDVFGVSIDPTLVYDFPTPNALTAEVLRANAEIAA